jgi:hypothetical protein
MSTEPSSNKIRKIQKVDANGNSTDPEFSARITRTEGDPAISKKYVITAERMLNGNWRDDDSISFIKSTGTEPPQPDGNRTVIKTTADGKTWLASPNMTMPVDLTSAVPCRIETNGNLVSVFETDTKQDKLSNEYLNNIKAVPDKANTTDLSAHMNSTTPHVSSADRTNWNGKVDRSQGPTNANRNVVTDAFGNITTEVKPTIPDISVKVDRSQGQINAGKVLGIDANGFVVPWTIGHMMPLFTSMFFTHVPNDAGWKLSDGSWITRSAYPEAYDYLVDQNNMAASESLIVPGSVTITVHKARNGMRFERSESNINHNSAYNATGIAWWYVLDTTNQRFMLPRNDRFFRGGTFADMALQQLDSAPNIIGTMQNRGLKPRGSGSSQSTGALASDATWSSNGNTATEVTTVSSAIINFDASRCSAVYGRAAEIRPRAVAGMLYFYLGNVVTGPMTANLEQIVNNMDARLNGAKKWAILWEDITSTAGNTAGCSGINIVLPQILNLGDVIRVFCNADSTSVSGTGIVRAVGGSCFIGVRFAHDAIGTTGTMTYDCFYGIEITPGSATVTVRNRRSTWGNGTSMISSSLGQHRVIRIEKEVSL